MLSAKVGHHDFTAPGGEIVGSGDQGKLKKRKRKLWKEALKNNPKPIETNIKNDANFETFLVSFGRGADWTILGPSNATKEGNLTAEHPTKEQQHQ